METQETLYLYYIVVSIADGEGRRFDVPNYFDRLLVEAPIFQLAAF